MDFIQIDPTSTLIWQRRQADVDKNDGKAPKFDHTTFSPDGYYVHVGGQAPTTTDPDPPTAIGSLYTPIFVRTEDQSGDEFLCQMTFYVFHQNMDPNVGKINVVLLVRYFLRSFEKIVHSTPFKYSRVHYFLPNGGSSRSLTTVLPREKKMINDNP